MYNIRTYNQISVPSKWQRNDCRESPIFRITGVGSCLHAESARADIDVKGQPPLPVPGEGAFTVVHTKNGFGINVEI